MNLFLTKHIFYPEKTSEDYSKEELIEFLGKACDFFKRPVFSEEYNLLRGFPPASFILEQFGSWPSALEVYLYERYRGLGKWYKEKAVLRDLDELIERNKPALIKIPTAVLASHADPVDRDKDNQVMLEILKANIYELKDHAYGYLFAPTRLEANMFYGRIFVSRYVKKFGSWEKGLEKIGIILEQRLIEDLRQVSNVLKGIPTIKAFQYFKGTASYLSYVEFFGSWKSAVSAAQLKHKNIFYVPTLLETIEIKPDNIVVNKEKLFKIPVVKRGSWVISTSQIQRAQKTIWSKSQLINLLNQSKKILGRNPEPRDLNFLEGLPKIRVFIEFFGSWEQALIESGLKQKISYSREQLIESLKKKQSVLGEIPRLHDMIDPPSEAYIEVFGDDWRSALAEANII